MTAVTAGHGAKLLGTVPASDDTRIFLSLLLAHIKPRFKIDLSIL